jgi:hypothetical protein
VNGVAPLRYPCPLRTCDWAYEVNNEPGSDGTRPHPGVDEVEAAIINHGHGHTAAQWIDEITALTQQISRPAPIQWCTHCVVEHKQAQLAGTDPVPVLPGVVLATTMTPNGPNISLFCEVRHFLNVGPPKLLLAPAGAIPNGGLRG